MIFIFQIRTRGGLDDHLSPLNAIYLLRMILLGKNPGIVTKQTNVLPVVEHTYLMASVLQKANINFTEINNPEKEEQNQTDFVDDTEIDNLPIQSSYESDGLKYIAGYLTKKHMGNSHTLEIILPN